VGDGGAVDVGGGVGEGLGVAVDVAEGVAVGVAVATAQEAAGAGADDRPIDSAKMCSSTRTRVAPRSPRAGRGKTGKRSAATRLPRFSLIAV